MHIQIVFNDSCRSGNLEKVKELVMESEEKTPTLNSLKFNSGLKMACENGHFEIMKFLLTSKSIKNPPAVNHQDNFCFRYACANGHLEIVKYLLTSPDLEKHADIHAAYDYGLKWACMNGHHKVISFLFNETDEYTMEKIQNICFFRNSEISKQEVIEMISARDLKNQLSKEVLLKDTTSRRKASGI